MLKDLDRVDWKSLKHAIGKAKDVPGLLQGLIASGDEPRMQSFYNLSLCLQSGGRVYPASAAAVPFLHSIGCTPATHGRALALILLAEIGASGTQGRLISGLDLSDPATRKAFSKAPTQDCHEAVLAGAPSYIELLKDAEGRVRGAAAFVLAFLPESAKEALPALRKQQFTETDPWARASELLALGHTARLLRSTEDQEWLAELLNNTSQPPQLRAAAALALRILGAPASRSQAEAIAQMIPLGQVGQERFPWNEGRADLLATQALSLGSAEERELAARTLVQSAKAWSVSALPNTTFHGIWTQMALALLFVRRTNDEITPQETSEVQRQIFSEIVGGGLLAAPGVLAADFGLPKSLPDARRWLGIDAPGPLDRPLTLKVGDSERNWPAWKALLVTLRGGLAIEVFERALEASLANEEILALYGEAALNIYQTSLPAGGHARRVAQSAGEAGRRWAQGYAAQLSEMVERGVQRITPAAVILALTPLIEGGRELDSQFDGLAALAFEPTAEAKELILAVPQARRETLLMIRWARFSDAGMGLRFLAPVFALAKSERLAEEVLGVFPKIQGEALIQNAVEVLKSMGPLAVPAIHRALERPDLPHRARIEALSK